MRQIRYIWLLVGILLAGMVSAQNVSNASFQQNGEKVVISYTLDKVASVTVQVSTDGGTTFSAPLKHVSGDVGENVKAGNNRIVWDALREYDKVVSNRVQFLITATDNSRSSLSSQSSQSGDGKHEYVDLGLPSGTLWATCNVGANRPTECGDYFAWGETTPKSSDYTWETYKYYSGKANDVVKFSKYSPHSKYGRVDNKTVLDLSDDAARANWGAPWRMPTQKEMRELCWDCKWTRTTLQGVEGHIVTGPNGNSIFLPVAGYMADWGEASAKDRGRYWTSSLKSDSPSEAHMLYFDDTDGACIYDERNNGYPIRPVVSATAANQARESTRSRAVAESQTSQVDDNHGYVDLGLPSGILWATCNVGAASPEQYGDYYAWGETTPKTTYYTDLREGGYKWGLFQKSDANLGMTKYNKRDGKITLDPQDDAATANWGGDWRMPTEMEINELERKCTWTWTTLKGVKGYRVTGPNGKYIFLPAAGRRSYDLEDVGKKGYFWSSTLYESNRRFGRSLNCVYSGDSKYSICTFDLRSHGHSVRPVRSAR